MNKKLFLITLIAGCTALNLPAQSGGGGGAGGGGGGGAGGGATGGSVGAAGSGVTGGTGGSMGSGVTGGTGGSVNSGVTGGTATPGTPATRAGNLPPTGTGQASPFNTDTGVTGGRNPAILNQQGTGSGVNVNTPRTGTQPVTPGVQVTPGVGNRPGFQTGNPLQPVQPLQSQPNATTVNNPAQLQNLNNQFDPNGNNTSRDQLGRQNNPLSAMTNQFGAFSNRFGSPGLSPTGRTNGFNRVLPGTSTTQPGTTPGSAR